MSRLDDLVHKLCPNGVHYYTIDELIKNKIIALISPIYKIKQKEYLEIGSTPIISQEAEYVSGYTNLKDPRLPNDEYVCFGDHTEHLKYVDFEFVQGADGLKVMHIENKEVLNTKYYYYVCSSYYLKKNTYERHFKHLRECLLPLPPLEVQKEIVHLLDDFTAKTAELQAELNKEYEARKKQYEYYRETVLNDNLDSMTVKIGDVADLKAGATPKTSNPEFWENGTIPWMSSGEVNQGKVTYTEKKITELGYNSSSTKMLPSETVVIALAGQGKTRGTVAITQIPLCTNQSLCGICAKDELNSMYLYHYLKSRYEDLRAISNGDGTRGGLNLKMIANYDIPLPPLEVQMKIVNILDKLDSINNDMYSSINNEIESRQKQYEFYRDKLLTFKELK